MRALALAALVLVVSCTSYEYEEEIFLGIDGSGRIRVSGSRQILPRIHDVEEATVEGLRRLLGGEGVELVSVRETERRGRSFLHAQMRFADWNALCASAAFESRPCAMRTGDDEITLEFALPASRGDPPEDLPEEATLAVRFHLPSRVHFHNSPSGIERGNILTWERSVPEHFGGSAVPIEARFGTRSVLAATARILLLAAGLVVGCVATALYLIVRKGRRQLAADAAAAD